MANEQSPERPQVTEGQRGQRIVKIEVADLTHGPEAEGRGQDRSGSDSFGASDDIASPCAADISAGCTPPPTQPQAAPSAEKK